MPSNGVERATTAGPVELTQEASPATDAGRRFAPTTERGRPQLVAPDGAVRARPGGDAQALRPTVAPSGERTSPPLRRILVAADLVAVCLGWTAAMLVAVTGGDIAFGPLTAAAQTVVVVGAGMLLASASGLYRRRVCAIRSVEVARIGRVSLALTALTVVMLASIDREVALLAGVVAGLAWFLILSVERGVIREWINSRRATGDFGAPVLVVGGGSSSTLQTAGFLAAHPVLGFQVSGVSCPGVSRLNAFPFPWFGAPVDVFAQMQRAGASGVVLDSSSLTGDELNRIVQQLEATGAHVHISSGLRGVDVRRITVSPIADEAFLHLAPVGLSRRQLGLKRALDLAGATTALVLLGPVLAAASLAVWLQDRGPVLFRQYRVGKDGELFRLLKLRTMVCNAEALKAGLVGANERTGPLFKLGNDPRVTRIGRFLRATSIDELPQLFNVLRGDMSLVGPRPALAEEVAQFDDAFSARASVKPGVTGLWQVEARDLASFDLYRRYDLLYVQNWSPGVDLAVIARTVVVVLLRAGRAMVPRRDRGSEVAS